MPRVEKNPQAILPWKKERTRLTENTMKMLMKLESRILASRYRSQERMFEINLWDF